MGRAERAVEIKKTRNCCQAVALAFSDIIDIPEDRLDRIGSAFGAGMGGMEGNCGALVGAVMVLGFLADNNPAAKKLSKDVLEKFREKCGSTICKELKGVGTGKMLCSCNDCVAIATRLVEEKMA